MRSPVTDASLAAMANWLALRCMAVPAACMPWGMNFASFLLLVVGLMESGSVERLIAPEPIHCQDAMLIAVLGLVVNLVSARILGAAQHHGHGHNHHGHARQPGHHHDLSLKSACLHVIAGAATSLAAIAARAGGWWLGWSWLDPVMGIFGAVVVALWAKGLVVETGKVPVTMILSWHDSTP